jgi:hypothetical protein
VEGGRVDSLNKEVASVVEREGKGEAVVGCEDNEEAEAGGGGVNEKVER